VDYSWTTRRVDPEPIFIIVYGGNNKNVRSDPQQTRENEGFAPQKYLVATNELFIIVISYLGLCLFESFHGIIMRLQSLRKWLETFGKILKFLRQGGQLFTAIHHGIQIQLGKSFGNSSVRHGEVGFCCVFLLCCVWLFLVLLYKSGGD